MTGSDSADDSADNLELVVHPLPIAVHITINAPSQAQSLAKYSNLINCGVRAHARERLTRDI